MVALYEGEEEEEEALAGKTADGGGLGSDEEEYFSRLCSHHSIDQLGVAHSQNCAKMHVNLIGPTPPSP